MKIVKILVVSVFILTSMSIRSKDFDIIPISDVKLKYCSDNNIYNNMMFVNKKLYIHEYIDTKLNQIYIFDIKDKLKLQERHLFKKEINPYKIFISKNGNIINRNKTSLVYDLNGDETNDWVSKDNFIDTKSTYVYGLINRENSQLSFDSINFKLYLYDKDNGTLKNIITSIKDLLQGSKFLNGEYDYWGLEVGGDYYKNDVFYYIVFKAVFDNNTYANFYNSKTIQTFIIGVNIKTEKIVKEIKIDYPRRMVYESPNSYTVDDENNLYILDSFNNYIIKIKPDISKLNIDLNKEIIKEKPAGASMRTLKK
jgi:hypothetical protein